ncbi:MAG: hypothetical protein IJS05_04180 [Paludibacteraceae bacterium]|nr:hypothetical protein [Paludibacteraceae bacterium]
MPHGYDVPFRHIAVVFHIGVGSALLVRLVGRLIPLDSNKQWARTHAFVISMVNLCMEFGRK